MGYASWVTQSQAVLYGKAAIRSIVITSASSGPAYVKFYEGRDNAGRILLECRVPANEVYQLDFQDGIPVQDGLYVELVSNVTGVLVLWEHLAEEVIG